MSKANKLDELGISRDTIIIEIEGGVLQEVHNDSNGYILFDWDNIKEQGETELTNNVRTSVVDFDTADMNDLHNTAIELVAAQGVSHVIIPIKITAFVNRSASTTQAVAKDLMYGYNGAVVVGQGVWAYHRRFMYNEGGDRVLCPFELAEIAQDDGDAIDRPLTAKMTAAITTDSIDSMRVITQYYVADLS